MDRVLASRTMLEAPLAALKSHGLTISHFVVSVLQHSSFTEHPAVKELLTDCPDILDALLNHPKGSKSTVSWATRVMKTRYAAAIRELADQKNGWHFVAAHLKADQLEAFRIEHMARDIQLLAPELWELIGLMLSADERISATEPSAEDDPMVTDDDEEEDLPKGPKTRAEKNAERRDALLLIGRGPVAMLFTYVICQPPWRGSSPS
ncbi:hypothetical protein GGX14DRAFT_625297 [Mycena pura]|uniref:Uncharacterized protein n=1 Tax=Mycena pura TaxID=153505 RepID=A0AAD6VFZ9_9AGAR|nr:hypothetical protein GGX14DRAFT_625297 [Mycena pura]